MAARVSPTERIRAQIDELFASEGDLGEVLEQVYPNSDKSFIRNFVIV